MADIEAGQYKFTPEELELLQDTKAEWQAADRKQRHVVAEGVYETFKDRNSQWGAAEKKLKKQGVHWWFHCFGRKRGSRERFDAVKKWTARMVLGVEYEKELDQRILAKAKGEKMTSKAYFSEYQKELSELIKGVPNRVQEKAQLTADLWNKIGPPREQQLKSAEKHGFQYVRSFCRQMKKACGMDCLVLTVYQDKGENVVVQYHEYMRELGGLSFFAENPKWREGDVVTTVMKHGQKMYDDADAIVGENGRKTRKPYVWIEVDDAGHPQLPPKEEWPAKVVDQKALIRGYVVLAYRRATGSDTSITPWNSILNMQDEFIHPEFLPDGFQLREPSKLKEGELQQLLRFWYDRQSDEDVAVPFAFHSYQLKGDGSFQPSQDAPVSQHQAGRKRGRPSSDTDSDAGSTLDSNIIKRGGKAKRGPHSGKRGSQKGSQSKRAAKRQHLDASGAASDNQDRPKQTRLAKSRRGDAHAAWRNREQDSDEESFLFPHSENSETDTDPMPGRGSSGPQAQRSQDRGQCTSRKITMTPKATANPTLKAPKPTAAVPPQGLPKPRAVGKSRRTSDPKNEAASSQPVLVPITKVGPPKKRPAGQSTADVPRGRSRSVPRNETPRRITRSMDKTSEATLASRDASPRSNGSKRGISKTATRAGSSQKV